MLESSRCTTLISIVKFRTYAVVNGGAGPRIGSKVRPRKFTEIGFSATNPLPSLLNLLVHQRMIETSRPGTGRKSALSAIGDFVARIPPIRSGATPLQRSAYRAPERIQRIRTSQRVEFCGSLIEFGQLGPTRSMPASRKMPVLSGLTGLPLVTRTRCR